jgi:hypothetical protein
MIKVGARGIGEFLSQFVMDYHARLTREPTNEEIAVGLRRLADLLDTIDN